MSDARSKRTGEDLETRLGRVLRTGPNTAEVSTDYAVRPEQLEGALLAAVERLPRWSFKKGIVSGEDSGLRFVRRTRVFGFKDDVTARVTALGTEGSRLEARSASRVGKSDLGQNPRNLKELLRALQRVLDPGD
ncbi:Protein of unknown function (DUF1499) [Rubrobacter radiotolerans]|uniref:DUF1499 domain-containing protein n=1 Tax=Rubrobacter radiotolerans TaxID=42256 RepID=A0A023X1U6_RUBRA|nr:DUF1499 domain-containing protein [Rubrobacter radiotolerans]AHY46318.1 Protein of unknown function (DUF1499) [Rubrobacter radiotolerans]MDX5893725.1 DUF1499 domain-containing protein [Rubrobacter radiotolerans]SMC04364.1 Protein of unknown function [Rubrobacter radiotolerans DSM 5868]